MLCQEQLFKKFFNNFSWDNCLQKSFEKNYYEAFPSRLDSDTCSEKLCRKSFGQNPLEKVLKNVSGESMPWGHVLWQCVWNF